MTDVLKIGRIVRVARKGQRMSQSELAAISGVGLRFISDLERGKESCHIGKVLHVVKMLGLEIIIGGEEL